jgi:hypothetical protein
MRPPPEFKTTKRDGGIALWVEMPDGDYVNIWDVSKKEFTDNVQSAIIAAFMRGTQYMTMLHAECGVSFGLISRRKFKDAGAK